MEEFGLGMDLNIFMNEIDINKNMKINFSEFMTAFYDFKKNVKKNELENFFKILDLNHDGRISKDELSEFFTLSEDDEILEEMMWIADKNKDGKISLDEFIAAIDATL